MQVAKRLQHLGIQNAARKIRPSSLEPGAWAGAIFRVYRKEITKTVSQPKWDKAKAIVVELDEELSLHDGLMDYKRLEEARGFLGHLAMTFSLRVPFLKGSLLALSSFLSKRDVEGWKMSDRTWQTYLQNQVDKTGMTPEEMYEVLREVNPSDPPKRIQAVPRLEEDIRAFLTFFSSDEPPEVQVRAKVVRNDSLWLC
jgi:hypothetical protein